MGGGDRRRGSAIGAVHVHDASRVGVNVGLWRTSVSHNGVVASIVLTSTNYTV